MSEETKKAAAACLGVIRLDYDYPPAPGDIDHPDSFNCDVYYKVVPGLTFEMCQKGKMTDDVEKRFKQSIKWLVKEKKVNGITGDCGFMMNFQSIARQITKIPIFMSSLCQLPAVTCGYAETEQMIIMTANGKSLEPMRDLIRDECGVDTQDKRYNIVGCEDVPHFGQAVANGDKVNTKNATPGIVKKAVEALKKYPKSRAFLLECTELPPYSDAIRFHTGLPVYDSITACHFFISGHKDNPRFGLDNWQDEFDEEQEEYQYGDNLTKKEKAALVNKVK
ncbi:uncharacterized protein [Acropora muricata]|uniref:dimethylsulfonioproprionate lyase 7-like n=1 Tax=Acropora millepora TaxID=45264 RepID=UPI001CF1F3EA|nr:dimethylsulfonioproprionate lyase 7-like [Acropora millepora]